MGEESDTVPSVPWVGRIQWEPNCQNVPVTAKCKSCRSSCFLIRDLSVICRVWICNTAVEDHIWNVVRSKEAAVVQASFCHWECPVGLNPDPWATLHQQALRSEMEKRRKPVKGWARRRVVSKCSPVSSFRWSTGQDMGTLTPHILHVASTVGLSLF